MSKFTSRIVYFIFLVFSVIGVFFSLKTRNYSSYYLKEDIILVEFDGDLEFNRSVGYISKDILDENFEFCFSLPFKEVNSNVNLFVAKNLINADKNTTKDEANSALDILLKFTELSRQLRIQTMIIDPVLLFCILSKTLKAKLKKRKLSLNSTKNDAYLLTLGVTYKYEARLRKNKVIDTIKQKGFEVEFVERSKPKWMKYKTRDESLITSHVFFKYKQWTLHLVVFYPRSKFLWHSSLWYPETSSISHNGGDNFFFAHSDGAFENFTAVSLEKQSETLKHFRIPSNPAEFLFEIESSRFLECNMTVVDNFMTLKNDELPANHSSFSVSDFNAILLTALNEIKAELNPLFLRFWIWSGTMLGWYRQCDVIPYTGDVDFGAWSSDVDSLDDLVKIFQKNGSCTIKQRMGLVDQGLEFNLRCSSLRVDIFFVQYESNGTWYAGHRPSRKYYFKYHHPNFSLCSAELLEHKVLVPCETEQVISTEYGPNWMQPVSHWNYESSVWNRGPNIYWNETVLKDVNVDY